MQRNLSFGDASRLFSDAVVSDECEVGRLSLPRDGLRIQLRLKRAIDVVGSAVGLLLAAPFVALAALAIRLDSPGPILFSQMRCGLDGRPFRMWKLRSMIVDAEAQLGSLLPLNEMCGPLFKIARDPRITRVGRWLRRTSIDEIPQLWNVLRGEMSLVGPRPPLPREVEHYDAREHARLSVPPGLTGLWQVSGRSQIDFEGCVQLDLTYINEWSLAQDLRILARTPSVVFRGTGAR